MKGLREKLKKLKKALPADAVTRISKKKKISDRMVRYILNGAPDHHGVIEEAIRIRDVKIAEDKELAERI